MTIVRNACLDWISADTGSVRSKMSSTTSSMSAPAARTPEAAIARASEARWLRECIEALPRDYREVLVLRELEEPAVQGDQRDRGVPLGTVMSRLARARDLLQQRVEARKRMRS